MIDQLVVAWFGRSGSSYVYHVSPLDVGPLTWPDEPGMVIFAKADMDVHWQALYIRGTSNLREFFGMLRELPAYHYAGRLGLFLVHCHTGPASGEERRHEADDLILRHMPV